MENEKPKRISAPEAMRRAGLTMGDLMDAGVVPACCDDGCEVEPDGNCPHGHESVLLAMGMI